MMEVENVAPHLFNQRRDPKSTVKLLETIKIFERSVELGHQGPLVYGTAIAGVQPCATQQIILGCWMHRPGKGRVW